MMKVISNFLFIIFWVCIVPAVNAQCAKQVKAFKPGEKITYHAYYNWGFIWVHAGDVEFSVNQKSYLNRQAYYFEAIGNSLKSYDWMYKVRDRFQAIVDKETFSPMWFEKRTQEGSYKSYENYVFTLSGKVFSAIENSNKPYQKDTLFVSPCTFDLLALIYYSRTINFETYKINEKIPLKTIVDNQVYPIYLRYLGKETIKTKDGKKFRCIKFSALLIEGTIFKGGEDMNIYVTEDENRIPVLVEAKILIGSVKAYLNTVEGASHEMSALVK